MRTVLACAGEEDRDPHGAQEQSGLAFWLIKGRIRETAALAEPSVIGAARQAGWGARRPTATRTLVEVGSQDAASSAGDWKAARTRVVYLSWQASRAFAARGSTVGPGLGGFEAVRVATSY